jgi:hypothetical protein
MVSVLAMQNPSPAKKRVKKFAATHPLVSPAGSRGPLLCGTNLSSMGKALRLFGKLGTAEGWIPACTGKTSNGLRLPETRTPFLHALYRADGG